MSCRKCWWLKIDWYWNDCICVPVKKEHKKERIFNKKCSKCAWTWMWKYGYDDCICVEYV